MIEHFGNLDIGAKFKFGGVVYTKAGYQYAVANGEEFDFDPAELVIV